MGVKGDLESSSKATEELAKESCRSPIEVNKTEAIIAEPMSAVPPVETEILKVDKKLYFTTVAEPTTTDVADRLEQTKKESIKKNSNASIIIR